MTTPPRNPPKVLRLGQTESETLMSIGTLKAAVRGFIEFRSGVGMTYGYARDEAYDRGRDLAHRLTRRKWDEGAWDYCYSPQCERDTIWGGEFCTSCGREWGYPL